MRTRPILLALLFATAGCAGNDSTAPAPDPAGMEVTSLVVGASAALLPAGFETPLTVLAERRNGNRFQPTGVTWSVDRSDLAAVDSTGVVRGLRGQGRVTVTATMGGVSGSVSLDVMPLPGRLAVEQWNGNTEDGLAIIPMDGSPRTLMAIEPSGHPFARPAWSPDGTRLAYACKNGETNAVCVSDADGSNRIRVAESSVAYDFGPSWWPDGNTLLVSDQGRLWRVASDAAGVPESVLVPASQAGDALSGGRPSPDGGQIAYLSYYWAFPEDAALCVAPPGKPGAICLDGTQQPAWSPDGKTLVAPVYNGLGQGLAILAGDNLGLLRILVPTSPPARLGTDQWSLSDPAWSPDGLWVAFSVNASVPRVPTQSVYLVRAGDGSNLVRLSSGGREYAHPSWGR